MRIKDTGEWYTNKSKDEIEYNNRLLEYLNNNNKDDIEIKINDNDEKNNVDVEKLQDDIKYKNKNLTILCRNGYLKLPDNILYELIQKDKNKMKSYKEISLFLFISKQTIGFQRKWYKVDIKEISKHMGIQYNNVYKIIYSLKEKGYIHLYQQDKSNWYVMIQMNNDENNDYYTIIPDFLLYSIINKKVTGLSSITDIQVLLFLMKYSFGYINYQKKWIDYQDKTGKMRKKLENRKTDDFQQRFYIKNGMKGIREIIKCGKSSLSKVMNKLDKNNIIDINKDKRNVEIIFHYDFRVWKVW